MGSPLSLLLVLVGSGLEPTRSNNNVVRAMLACLFAGWISTLPCCSNGNVDATADGGSNTRDTGAALDLCALSEQVFTPKCTACHDPGGTSPDLTSAALMSSLVDVESSRSSPARLVVPGRPADSLLYRKLAGSQAPSEGGRMPPNMPLGSSSISLIERWIREGADSDCDLPNNGLVERHHPAGYDAREVHGVDLKLGTADCRECHGTNLAGSRAPSCDSCHEPTWRSDCVYCHGGDETNTGAPPRELVPSSESSFPPHTAHVTARSHPAYECTACHAKPGDAMTREHIFDSTPGRAEVRFLGGLSTEGEYAGNGVCNNLYCHGTGRIAGRATASMAKPGCDGCHADMSSGALEWEAMSGGHESHLSPGMTCDDCHDSVSTQGGTAIKAPLLHVNGSREIVMSETTITLGPGNRCNGTCHAKDHLYTEW